MKARGRSEEPQPRAASARPYKRDPSTSSLGTEVRCACQFFQTDSLLPERSALQRSSRPASRTRMATTIGDHEYEPISPPPAEAKLADPGKLVATEVKVSDAEKASEKDGPTLPAAKSFDDDVEMELAAADGAAGKDVSDTSSIDSRERRFLRVPLDDELIVPGDGDTEEAAMAGKELGDSNNEGARYIATPTPTTTESRTDCELNTSQVDSSGLEDLPLKRGARKRMTAEEEVTNGRPFHQRIRSQAGRIRTKLRNMSRPKFTMPDRPRFSLPERPKFNLPERPKFSLPDRPKIHLPERPKINLPERPKINLPERPKISLPERPKFSFPERPKFNLPERPKFHMPQRPKFSMPSISSARSTAPKKTTSSSRRPLRDKVSTESSASSQKKFFDFDFKSYPRLFERKKHEFATSSPKGGRAMTPPLPKSRKKGPIGTRWLHRFSDIKYADEENRPELGDDESEGGPPGERIRVLRDVQISDSEKDDMEDQIDSGNTESTTAFRDKNYGYAISVEQPQTSPALDKSKSERSIESAASDREQRSSGSSSDRRRAGVLEEIDSDEFFLREKGISQEDVAVGRYLTSEIRDAFRSPVSALTKMTGDSFESEGGDQMARQYRGNKITGDSFESEGGDQMVRPYRGPKMTGDSFESEGGDQLAMQYRGTPEREPSRPARTRSLHGRKRGSGKSRSPSEEVVVASEDISYNTFPPTRPKRNRRIRDDALQQDEPEETAAGEIPTPRVQPDAPTFKFTGPQDSVEQPPSEDTDEHWAMEVEDDQPLPEPAPLPEPPQAPKRKRRSRKDLTDILPSPARYDDEDFNESIEVRYTGGFDEKLNAENQYVNGHIEDEVMEKDSIIRDEAVKAILNGHYTKEDWLDSVQSSGTRDEQVALRAEPDYIIPAAPYEGSGTPVAPKRGRRKGSRGTSLADEDRTSRAASTLPSEHGGDVEVEPEADAELELEAEVGGYASVTARPERPRRPKATVPVVPGRRRRSLGHANGNRPSHFFSLPRRAIRAPPVRPVRNYSTLGPSRPPRRTKALSQPTLEHEYVEQDAKNEPYVEIEEDAPHSRAEESQESNRDLQSGDVIEKMKGRPLPPPPRPPRKTREGKEAHEETKPEDAEVDIEDVEEALAALNDDAFYTHKTTSVQLLEQEGLLKAPLEKSADEDLEEASVATQTDPLPDDLCVEAAVEEPPTFADASTETNGKLPSSPLEETPTLDPGPPPAPEPEPEKISKTEVIEETTVQRVESVYREPPVVHEETPKRPEPTAPRQPTPPQPIIIEKPIPYYVMPDPDTEVELKAQRLQVAELDVERLNVGELQAQKILVSDIDGVTMQVTELTSKSGNLVVNNIELPSGFLQDLYDALPHPPSAPAIPAVSSSPETQPAPTAVTTTPSVPPVQVPITAAQEAKVEAPPPPSIPPLPSVQHLQSVPPHEHVHPFISEYMPPRAASRPRSHISASQRDLESEEEMISLMPSPPSRRRRHHASSKPPVVRYSSDEEEEDEYHPTPPSRRHLSRGGAAGDQQPVVELGRQLVQACQGAVMRAVRQSLLYASSRLQEGEDGRRDLQTLLCILLVMVAALILLGFGSGKTFHHHHWDYLFPPPAP